MGRRNDNILDVLVTLPWWVSVIFSGTIYIFLSYIIPGTFDENQISQTFALSLSKMAPWIALIFLIPAPISALIAWRKRKLLDNQKNIRSIRALSWKQFEMLVAEAYRRKGFQVLENQGAGPDGGIDIRLMKNNQKYLVQCKQWRTSKVGVKVVREMYGIMTAENVFAVIIITSGIFTQEAQNFAAGKPIDLIDGSALESLIGQVSESSNDTNQLMDESVNCPQCGSVLKVRVARKGIHAGQKFYGCSAFPRCRYTRDYTIS